MHHHPPYTIDVVPNLLDLHLGTYHHLLTYLLPNFLKISPCHYQYLLISFLVPILIPHCSSIDWRFFIICLCHSSHPITTLLLIILWCKLSISLTLKWEKIVKVLILSSYDSHKRNKKKPHNFFKAYTKFNIMKVYLVYLKKGDLKHCMKPSQLDLIWSLKLMKPSQLDLIWSLKLLFKWSRIILAVSFSSLDTFISHNFWFFMFILRMWLQFIIVFFKIFLLS